MIYCSTNNTNGRLGNQVMRVMSLMGLSNKINCDYVIPKWPYAQYFKNEIRQTRDNIKIKITDEPHYHYTPEFYEASIRDNKKIDIKGYLQSYKYWEQKLEFTDDFIAKCKNEIGDVTRPIAISIRRGDFVNNPNYYQLPIKYYILALTENFPDWGQRSLLFFSDDIEYCKLHFQCLPNAVFVGGSDVEQLCKMTLCDDFVISNSTFSFCGAYLCNNKSKKVIRPIKNMDGPLAEKNSEIDYWPTDWIICEHENKKIDLNDTTFIIPVTYDHNDRKQNLELSVCMVQRDFDANVIVGENKSNEFSYFAQWCEYVKFDYPVFHRTKMINEMVKGIHTNYFFNWDADVVIPPMQVLYSVTLMREEGFDIVYPYDGRFARVDRKVWFNKISKSLDAGIFAKQLFKGMLEHPENKKRELIGDVEFKEKYNKLLSVGGAIGFKTDSFIEGGMENEYMISYAPKDLERYVRFHNLGYKGCRVKGVLYHIDHWRGADSKTIHKDYQDNAVEYDKVVSMSKNELLEYIKVWPWVETYNTKYYQEIWEEVKVAKEIIYSILDKMGIPYNTIIDFGCGIGQWFKNDYLGIDYNVRQSNLLIPKDRYIDFNMENIEQLELPFDKKVDLVLCLEVAEHISEEKSDALVKKLTEYGRSVLFSAAIPGQSGVGHINEQWQDYWAYKFMQNGYALHTNLLKHEIEKIKEIPIWYRNNMMLFVPDNSLPFAPERPYKYISPELYINLLNHWTAKCTLSK